MAHELEPEVVEFLGATGMLSATGPWSAAPLGLGGNNRIFMVEGDGGERYALKTYMRDSEDGVARLEAEYRALNFVRMHGVRNVPEPLAIDPEQACALFGWIDGEQIDRPRMSDVESALDFVRVLRRLSGVPGAAALPEAKEACLAGRDVTAQIDRRLGDLKQVAVDHGALAAFLEEFAESFTWLSASVRHGYRYAGLDFRAPVPRPARTLSPSDFGFHNALRCAVDTLAFVDFEYFGWDDPAKLASDFLLHPRNALDAAQRRRFTVGVHDIFGADPDFPARLRLLYPLFGLRWCMILLNAFLPRHWDRLAFAGSGEREDVLADRLAKAKAKLREVNDEEGGFPYDA